MIIIWDRYIESCLYSLSLSRLGAVMCLGVTAGAYILTLFAVSFSSFYGCVSVLLSINFDLVVIYCFIADEVLATCYGSDSCFPSMQSTILDRMVM